MKKAAIIIQIIILSLLFPVAILLLGLVFEAIYPGFFYYLSNLCHGLNDCIKNQPSNFYYGKNSAFIAAFLGN